MSIFTAVVFSTKSCRDVEELNASEIYESNNIKIMDGKFTLSNKTDSVKIGDHPKDPIKWGIVNDSIKRKK